MAEFLLEINDAGDTLEINDSADQLLILDDSILPPTPPVIVGGPSGGKSTQKGVSVFDQDRSLGERPVKKAPAKSEAKLIIRVESKSKGSILIPIKAFSESLITSGLGRGISVSKIVIPEKIHAIAQIHLHEKFESYGYIHRGEIIANATKALNKTVSHLEKLKKLTKLNLLFNMAESIEDIYQEQKPEKFKTFDFEESPEQWQSVLTEQVNPKKISKLWKEMSQKDKKDLLTKMKLNSSLSVLNFDELPDNVKKAFTDTNETDLINIIGLIGGGTLAGLFVNILDSPASEPISQIKEIPIKPVTPGKSIRKPSFDMPSSFVGKVIYDAETQGMKILLNGKPYNFCGVPERTFDSFQGADSKGAFFGRNIKGQFDC